jgi:hypothetical protein
VELALTVTDVIVLAPGAFVLGLVVGIALARPLGVYRRRED